MRPLSTSLSVIVLLSAAAVISPSSLQTISFAASFQDSLAGTYTSKTPDGNATLTLAQDGEGAINGTLAVDGDTMTLKGKIVEKGKAAGTISVNGVEVPLKFEVVRKGVNVQFSMILPNQEKADADMIFNFTPTGKTPVTPAASPKEKPAPAKTVSASPTKEIAATSAAFTVPATWKTYKHPAGLSMRYPQDWNMKEAEGVIQLLPPVVAQGAAGPSEIFLVQATPAEGVATVEDPRILPAVDGRMAQMFPALKRSATPEKLKSGGQPGLVLVYEGKNPQTDKLVQARVYGAIHKDYLIAVLAIGEKSVLPSREKTLRSIFGSFVAGNAEWDARLVGSWRGGVIDNGKLIPGAGGRIQTSVASDSSTQYILHTGGMAEKVTYSRIIVNSKDVSLDSGETKEVKKGKWNAGSGKIVVMWDDGGSLNGAYRLEGDTLIVTYTNGSVQRFSRR